MRAARGAAGLTPLPGEILVLVRKPGPDNSFAGSEYGLLPAAYVADSYDCPAETDRVCKRDCGPDKNLACTLENQLLPLSDIDKDAEYAGAAEAQNGAQQTNSQQARTSRLRPQRSRVRTRRVNSAYRASAAKVPQPSSTHC